MPTPPWKNRSLDPFQYAWALGDRYPLVEADMEGLRVGDQVPNTASIAAELAIQGYLRVHDSAGREGIIEEYEVLSGIRRVPLSDFSSPDGYVSQSDNQRVAALVEEIRTNGWIAPLIVVCDAEGPYILEGGHRFNALHQLGKKHLPAMIAVDYRSWWEKRVQYEATQAGKARRASLLAPPDDPGAWGLKPISPKPRR